jgi:hypothetical protein
MLTSHVEPCCVETDSNNDEAANEGRAFRTVFPWVCGGLILIALAVGPIRRSGSAHPNSITRPVILRMDTNGVLSFHGISLANPTFRHAVFKTLHALNQRVGVAQLPTARGTVSTNCMNTLMEIHKAGLFRKRE